MNRPVRPRPRTANHALVALLLGAVLCLATRGEAWAPPEDAEGDVHWSSMHRYLQEPTEPLRHEVLLVGDGERMRFWPMWPFYKYLASAVLPSPVAAPDAGGGRGRDREGGAGHGRVEEAKRMTLITPESRGFRRGMSCDEVVAKFARTKLPLLYFLVSPGDKPLLLSGTREYRGVKMLEVEDMEGPMRLRHLILSNQVHFVVYRYLNTELLLLQELCPRVRFLHLPFFIDSAHFHLPRQERASENAQARQRAGETRGDGNAGRTYDVLVYGNTWSHRYPLRHRVLRALTAGHITHNLTFRVIPHPGYFVGAQDPAATEDWNAVLCDDVGDAFWHAADGAERAAGDVRPACCGGRVCVRADCEAAVVRVAHGPLASCDDVHTCPGGSAWAATGGAETGGAEGAGLWMREQIRLLGPCVPLVRGRELGDAIRQAKIVVTDCIQGDTVYASTLEHAYLVAKYHEIAACGAVIAGNLPLSGHGSGLQDAVLELDSDMSDAHIIEVLQRAVGDAEMLRRKAAAGCHYFANSSYAHGARYWSALVAAALSSRQQDAEDSPALHEEQDDVSLALVVPLSGAGQDGRSVVAMAHNPVFVEDRSSQQLLAAFSQTPGPSSPDVWLSDPHRALVSAALAEVPRVHGLVPRKLMVEVGSGLGLMVLAAMSAGWRVLAFEALRSNLDLMQQAVRANGWSYASTTGDGMHREPEARLHSACINGGNVGLEEGGHVCGVHAAVARCGGYQGGKVVLAAMALDQGAGHVLQEPFLEALAGDEDMQHLTRAQDGSFRPGTRRPIAQALLTPICLDNALFADVPAVPGREEPVLADERRETQGWIDLLSINTGEDLDTASLHGGGGNVLAVLEGAKGILSGGRVRAVAVGVSSARISIEAVRMLDEAGYCLAYTLYPGDTQQLDHAAAASSSESGAHEASLVSLPLPASCEEAEAGSARGDNSGLGRGRDGTQVALYFLRRSGACPGSQGAGAAAPRQASSEALSETEAEDASGMSDAHSSTLWNAQTGPAGGGMEAGQAAQAGSCGGRDCGRGQGRMDEVLRQYQELHAKIVDPDDSSVTKRFLVLRSGHGIGNTMIEEVTALLMGLATGRAVVFDSRGGGVFGLERPVHCFHRPLLLDFEMLLPVFADPGLLAEDPLGAAVPGTVKAPEDTSASYARYAELLACSDWNATLGSEAWVSVEHLFGFPFAFLNKALEPLLSSSGVFGRDLFPALHAFLHRPVEYILDEARSEWQQHLASASCSVGLQVRWHHLAEDMQINADLGSHESIEALEQVVHLFVRTALDACAARDGQLAGGAAAAGGSEEGGEGRRGGRAHGDIVLWVAADYRVVYAEVRKVAAQMQSQAGKHMRVAHLSDQRAQGLRERPGHGGDLSGDNGEHEAALIDLEVLSACHVVVCTRLSTFGYVAHARSSFVLRAGHAVARPHGTTWQCSGHNMECRMLHDAQAGLVAAEPVHSAWPWTQERFRQLSCTSGILPLGNGSAAGVLSPV